MNEKIRELKEQAGITTNLDTDFYDKKDANKWMDYFAEQFAELIIRECAKVVEKEMDYHANWCDDKILKHFGMK